MITAADLRTVDLFDGVSDADLEPWLEVVEERRLEAGELLAEAGVPVDTMTLLIEGRGTNYVLEGDRPEPMGEQVAPTWLGAIAALTGDELGVRVIASEPCRLGVVGAAEFRRLALSQPAVHERVMRQVAPVMARLTALEQNRERLASLGTMAAGLAHELNNPASAASRASAQIADAVDVISSTLARFVEAGIERAEAEQLVGLQREALAGAKDRSALDALDAADAEDELRDALEDLGVAEAWRLAEPLAVAGVDGAWLERVHALAGPATDAALAWVAATLTARGLAAELQESTERMSRLVGAVKTYAYMDRGGVVEADIHEGLETTLVVLGHKLKHTSIVVEREYDRSLPKLTVHGSELNQVWTNLLDNAICALGDSGTITIATRTDGDCAFVEITDDGPGVPEEIKDRVFDAFFTTKDVGAGSGLGLSTARRIVVERHGGSLTLASRPGATTFRVSLPLPHR
jgi:signal transduction histidine kinase